MEKDILIIKVGTSTLTTEKKWETALDTESFSRIGSQIVDLQDEGYKPIIVSSAAITAGMVATRTLRRPGKERRMPELQRLASVGWRLILNEWDAALPGKTIGELLLTKNELDMPVEREEVLRVTERLLYHGEIPVVNENDPVSHDEIAYGDNDTLSATFAAKIAQSKLFNRNVKLVLLSDVDGVHEDYGNSEALITYVDDIDKYAHLAGDSRSANASGGMRTKFDAAKIATEAGVEMWIANGRTENAIERAINGEIGTYFGLS